MLDMTSIDAALKQHYTAQRLESMAYTDNPLHALLTKYEDFGGRNLPLVANWGNPQGRSGTFSTAQTRGSATSSKLSDFLLTRVKDYSVAYIDGETMKASEGDVNAFISAMTVEIDGAIRQLVRSVAIAEYGSGYGEIGQVASTYSSGNTFYLQNIDDITNFEVGQSLVCTNGTTVTNALRSGAMVITSIDRGLGTITCSANVVTSMAASEYLFVEGDRAAGAYTSQALPKIAGLNAWIPASMPASTAFFGVDRSVDTRLGGLRKSYTGAPIEEAIIDGLAYANREGAKVDHLFVNYAKFAEFEKALGSKVQYIDLKANAEVGFRGIVVNSGRGFVNVLPDQNCPSGVAFGLTLDEWKLYSLGKAIRMLDFDGLNILRSPTADSYEVRIGFYGNLGTAKPGFNIRLAL